MSYQDQIDEFRVSAQARQLRYYAKRFQGAYRAAQEARQKAGPNALGYLEEKVSPWDCAELAVLLERAADQLESGKVRPTPGRWWGFLGMHPIAIATSTVVYVAAVALAWWGLAALSGQSAPGEEVLLLVGIAFVFGHTSAARYIARGGRVFR